MKMNRSLSILIALASMASVFSSATSAAVVYNNSVNPQNSFFGLPIEFGDQIELAGPERILTTFSFDYYLSPTVNGNETVTLRLYNNDGASGAPGTLLLDSGPISIATGYRSVTADDLDITIQSSLTWTVLFGGIDPFESAGLLLYDPPVIGRSFNDYWEKSSSGAWSTKVFVDDPARTVANFGAVVSAVPEPSTLGLAIVGGLVWLGFSAKRRFLGQK